MPRVRIHALGGFRIVVDGRELRLRTRKEAMVLLRLATAGERGLARDELLGMLWPESSETRARHSLSEALRGIEQATPIEIVRNQEQLALPSGSVALDADELDEAMRSGDVGLCTRLYIGGFLAGWYPPTPEASHWVDGQGARIARMLEKAMRAEIVSRRQATDSRGVVAAVALLEKLGVATDEDHEAAAEAEQITRWESLRPGEGIQSPLPLDREGPFVGRTAEMKLLTSELDRALAGELRVVLVSGEAGIGKTRTCQRLARLAALRGCRLFMSTCYELEQSVAFGAIGEAFGESVTPGEIETLKPLWRDALASVLPTKELRDGRGGIMTGRHTLPSAFAALFRNAAAKRTLFLAIDDIQWADVSSCLSLHYLIRTSNPAAGALVLLAFRPDAIRSGDPSAVLAAAAEALGAARVHIGPMSPDDVLKQVEVFSSASREQLAEVVDLAGGNPFFARELAIAYTGQSGITPSSTLADVILSRCNRLGERERTILTTLAVAGAPMPLLRLARILETPSVELVRPVAALERLHLTTEANGELSVSHDLTRKAVYESLSDFSRRGIHGSIAKASETEAPPSFLAYHYERAGLLADANRFALDAAAISRKRRAYEEELRWLSVALSTTPKPNATLISAVAKRMGSLGRYRDSAELLGRYLPDLPRRLRVKRRIALLRASNPSLNAAEDIRSCDAIVEECIRDGFHEEVVEVLREKMRFSQEMKSKQTVLTTAQTLEDLSTKWEDPVDAFNARAVALLKLTSFDPESVRPKLTALQTDLSSYDVPTNVQLTVQLIDALDAYNNGQVRTAGLQLHELVTHARASGELAEEVRARSLLVPVSTEAMRFERASRHANYVFRYAELADAAWDQSLTLVNLSASRLEAGQLSLAARLAHEGAQIGRTHPMWMVRAHSLAVLGHCALGESDHRSARRLYDELYDILPPIADWVSDMSIVVTFLARFQALTGQQESALALARTARDQAEGRSKVAFWTLALEVSKLSHFEDGGWSSVEVILLDAESAGCRLVAAKARALQGFRGYKG